MKKIVKAWAVPAVLTLALGGCSFGNGLSVSGSGQNRAQERTFSGRNYSSATYYRTQTISGLSSLRGLQPQEILQKFGPPSFSYQDGPATIWFYRTKSCDLSLILYSGQTVNRITGNNQAVKAEQGYSDAGINDEACIRSIIARKCVKSRLKQGEGIPAFRPNKLITGKG